MGVALVTVSRWVRGEVEPPISTLKEIAQILDCTLYELLGLSVPSVAGCRISDVQEKDGQRIMTVIIDKKESGKAMLTKNIHDRLHERADALIESAHECEKKYSDLKYKAQFSNGNHDPLNFDEEKWKRENSEVLTSLKLQQEEAEMRYSEIVSEYYGLDGHGIIALCEQRVKEHEKEIIKVSSPDYDVAEIDIWAAMSGDAEKAECKAQETKRLRWQIEEARHIKNLAMIDTAVVDYKLHFNEDGRLDTYSDITDEAVEFVKANYKEIAEYIRENEDSKVKSLKFDAYTRAMEFIDKFRGRPYYASRIHYFACCLADGTIDPERVIRVCDEWDQELSKE